MSRPVMYPRWCPHCKNIKSETLEPEELDNYTEFCTCGDELYQPQPLPKEMVFRTPVRIKGV